MKTGSFSLPFIVAVAAAACSPEDCVANPEAATEGGITFTETTNQALPSPIQPCGPGTDQGCYTNYGVVADLDGDGNFDLVLANGGDHFFPGSPEPQAVYFGK